MLEAIRQVRIRFPPFERLLTPYPGYVPITQRQVQVPEYASQNDLWFVVPPVEGIVGLDRHPGGFSLPSVVQGFRNTTTDALISMIGFSLLFYTVRQLYQTWPQIDKHGQLLQLALPVWLTIGYLPFIYLFSLIAGYEQAFMGINWVTADRKARWRGKIALMTKFHFRARETHGFPWMVAKQLCRRSHVLSRPPL